MICERTGVKVTDGDGKEVDTEKILLGPFEVSANRRSPRCPVLELFCKHVPVLISVDMVPHLTSYSSAPAHSRRVHL